MPRGSAGGTRASGRSEEVRINGRTDPHSSGHADRGSRQDFDLGGRRRRGGVRAVPRDRVSRLREDVRGPAVSRDAGADVARLRHLPGEPRAGQFQGGRRAAGRRSAAGGGQAAPPGELRAGAAVARAELLPSVVAGSAARHGCRRRRSATSSACIEQRCRTSRAAASGCGSSGSALSNWWAASASILAGAGRAAYRQRVDGRRARRDCGLGSGSAGIDGDRARPPEVAARFVSRRRSSTWATSLRCSSAP